MSYEVYTDGACSNNQRPGGQPGGWAAVFKDGRILSGAEPATTNNRMELKAAIAALRHTPPGAEVIVYSDSAYVVNAFQQDWFSGWRLRGWRNAKGKPVENLDLWQELLALAEARRVRWVKVAGHRGDPWNERADREAVAAMRRMLAGMRERGPSSEP
ncbi:MAG: ribonuclease HI [Firmicutes bacterium]|nr:ribonuclease HI [Alicyclobacillaceae bacterium]MCL6496604.1 ribonuclease HI [Bacillota bacterium]